MTKKPLTNKSGNVRELTSKDIRAMRPASEVLPKKLLEALPKRRRGERGPQKEPKKILVTKRYEPMVLDYFKSTGPGWQRRIDDVLLAYIKKHPKNHNQQKGQKHVKHQKRSRSAA